MLAEIGDINQFGSAVFRAYYDKRVLEGKNGKQILICISRRLVNIIYGMLKNGIEYQMPRLLKQTKWNRKRVEYVIEF